MDLRTTPEGKNLIRRFFPWDVRYLELCKCLLKAQAHWMANTHVPYSKWIKFVPPCSLNKLWSGQSYMSLLSRNNTHEDSIVFAIMVSYKQDRFVVPRIPNSSRIHPHQWMNLLPVIMTRATLSPSSFCYFRWLLMDFCPLIFWLYVN